MSKHLSVLIATRNRCELLQRTLPTVLQQDFPPGHFEVIVASDGCTDQTGAFLRQVQARCDLRLLELPHAGRAAALNAALAEARGEVVVFLDDDLLCSPTLLREHWQASADDSALLGLVQVAEVSGQGTAVKLRRGGLENFFMAAYDDSTPLAVGHANSSIARWRLLEAGGFDPSLVGSCEEVDCGFRLWKAGVRFAFAPRAVAREIYSPTISMLASRARAHGANEWRLCLKHPDYRPYSRLQQALYGSVIRQWLRRLAVRSPLDPAALLAPFIAGAERLPFSEMAVRLLGARMALSFFRGAAEEAGSWRKLVQYVRSAEAVAPPLPPKKQPAAQPRDREQRRA